MAFDIETNGLPDYNLRARDPLQPHIVQLAAILAKDDGTIIETYNQICRPDGWEITEELTAIHGITHAKALEVGIDEKEVATKLFSMIKQGTVIIGYNVRFDKFIARIALRRFDIFTDADDAYWKALNTFCAMQPMTNICKLPGQKPGKYKFPKLQESYRHAFKKEFSGAHDAMADLKATLELYFWIKNELKL